MATLAELESALLKADAAGNADDAMAFANAIRQMRAAPSPAAKPIPRPTQSASGIEPSIGGWAKRQADMFARGGLPGLTGATAGTVVGIPGGPVGMGAGALIGGLGGSALLKQYTDKLFPTPETTGERALEAAGSAVTGVGTQLPALASLAKGAVSPVVRGVSAELAKAPIQQAAIAGPSAATSQWITEGTDSPVLGTLAGLSVALAGSKVSGAFSKAVPPPTIEQLKAESGKQYKLAQDAGVMIKNDALQRAFGRILDDVETTQFDKDLHPRANTILTRIADEANNGSPVSLQKLEKLRRIASAAGESQVKSERKIVGQIISGIDDMVDDLSTDDLISGDADTASNALKSARAAWRKASKLELVQGVMEKAQNSGQTFSQSGLENNLRTQFRQLLNNPKKMRGFTQDERDAIQAIVRGDAPQNVLRWVGKLAPRGIVSAAVGGGGGAALGGAPGAIAVPAIGEMARAGATQMGMNKYNTLDELIRRGFTPQKENLAPLMGLRGLLSDPNLRGLLAQ